MKALLRCAGVAVVLAAVSGVAGSVASAQWADHPGANVPRLADGTPDLEAPAPRTADGKPDLSGIWENRRNRGRGGRGGRGGQGVPTRPEGEPPRLSFGNVGSGFEDGLPFRDWARELKAERQAANSKENPDALCLPLGPMQLHAHVQPRKIVQTPSVTAIIWEANDGIRQIFTDGRSLPDNDPQPWWYGYSVGHWEGDTLVVTSNHFRDGGWLDIQGSPFTDEMTLTERFRRVNYGTLEIEITVDDPKAYTEPFTVLARHSIMPDTELIEFICAENQKFLWFERE